MPSVINNEIPYFFNSYTSTTEINAGTISVEASVEDSVSVAVSVEDSITLTASEV